MDLDKQQNQDQQVKQRIAAAMLSGTPGYVQPAPVENPLILNQALEAQAQLEQARAPLSSPVQALMKRLGLLSLIRNRGNQQMVNPEGLQ